MNRLRCLVLAALTLLAACAGPQQPPKDDSLYQALGQTPGITRIVEGMLINMVTDPRTKARFAKVDPVRLRDKLVEEFCVETGGPCTYTGDSMEEVHKHMHLTPSDFNALVENLIAAMDAQKVPVPAQNRLLARLAPKRGEVIGK